jgi:hypothetical protein
LRYLTSFKIPVRKERTPEEIERIVEAISKFADEISEGKHEEVQK